MENCNSIKDSLYNRFFRIETFVKGSDHKIDKSNLLKKTNNKENQEKLNTIFSYFDCADGKQDNILSFNFAITEKGESTAISICSEIRYLFDENHNISERRIKDLFGEDTNISIADISEAIEIILDNSEDFAKSRILSDKEIQQRKSLGNKFDIPDKIKEKVDFESVNDVKIDNIENQKLYKIINSAGEVLYRENGTIHSKTDFYEEDDCEDYYGVIKSQTFYYDEEDEIHENKQICRYYSGLEKTSEHATSYFRYGRTEWQSKYNTQIDKDVPEFIKLNAGLPNEVKIEVKSDINGIVSDIKLPEDSYFKISDEIKTVIIKNLNEKIFGKDFNIKTDINQIDIEEII